MNYKTILSDGIFCPIPWTGVMVNFDGKVKNCIRSDPKTGVIGDLKNNSIEDILAGEKNLKIQERILESKQTYSCHTCYDLERGKKDLGMISDRIFYIKELKQQPLSTYKKNNFDLKVIDIRWSNQCNFGCVYCGPEFSSKWTKELNVIHDVPTATQIDNLKNYIFDNAANLQHVYMAGGEPLLMKQNLELLDVLKQKNPDVHLRINTNLSSTGTQVFENICEFNNVHWTISGETMGNEFEYIRYGGKWEDWLRNLNIIRKLDHKVSFNMLYFMLNYESLFDTIDFLKGLGFHNNSFIVGALLSPEYLNIRHLPTDVLQYIKIKLREQLDKKPGYLLEDSYSNLLHYINQPFQPDFLNSINKLQELDKRRNTDSAIVFPHIYKLKEKYYG